MAQSKEGVIKSTQLYRVKLAGVLVLKKHTGILNMHTWTMAVWTSVGDQYNQGGSKLTYLIILFFWSSVTGLIGMSVLNPEHSKVP